MKKSLSTLLALLPLAAFAHEGHGHSGGYTIIHYLTEPLHVVTALVVFAGLIVLYKSLKRQGKKA